VASTIERLRESLDPQSVSNALYNIMLLWLEADDNLNQRGDSKGGRHRRVYHQREAYEICLAAFLGVRPGEIGQLLRDHYGVRKNDGKL
jgi:hypothetical protein